MIQGSNMAQGSKGMRKGLSLMEMLIAIILFGIISQVGYSYYKNYMDTSLAAKQAKVATVVDQATQLRNALELYNVKFGQDATESTDGTLNELVLQRIITEVPGSIPSMSATGWSVSKATDIDITATALEDLFLTYPIDATGIAANDSLDYCNAVNNLSFNGQEDFSVVLADLGADDPAAFALYDTTRSYDPVDFWCYNNGGVPTVTFVAKYY